MNLTNKEEKTTLPAKEVKTRVCLIVLEAGAGVALGVATVANAKLGRVEMAVETGTASGANLALAFHSTRTLIRDINNSKQ